MRVLSWTTLFSRSTVCSLLHTQVELTSNYGPVVSRALLDESDDGTEVVLDDDINGAVVQLKYRDVNETVELKTQASEKGE